MKRLRSVASTMLMLLSLLNAWTAASADEGSLDHPRGTVKPTIKEIHVEKVSALTGIDSATDMKSVDICGTDLGTMTEIGNRIFFAFGDTFGYDGDYCSGVGGPNWRSNVFASTTDHNPAKKLILEDWLRGPDGKAIAVAEGAHQPAFTGEDGEQTKIPTAMVSVGDRIYLHYMSVHGFSSAGGVWNCNYSKFIYSDDLGKTWKEADLQFGGNDANFNMLALTHESGQGKLGRASEANPGGRSHHHPWIERSGDLDPVNEQGAYIYAMGTPCGRFGGVRLARVRKEDVLNIKAWEYFDSDHRWTADPGKSIEIIPAPVGEGSILWNPGIQRWLYTYLNEKTTSIELREAENPWGPWSPPYMVARAAEYPKLYGAFLTPSFLKDNGKTLYFVMSMYGPYNTFVMKASLVTY